MTKNQKTDKSSSMEKTHRSIKKTLDMTFSNLEIVTLVVYLLGGDTKEVDTEDIAIKANELAPGRFAWRKYKDQINIENVRTFLSDAKKVKNGSYLLGSGKKGWLLTENGLKFSKKYSKSLRKANLSRAPLSKEERYWLQREKMRMLASPTLEKLLSEGSDAVTKQDAESFFRVDDYVTGYARERKIARILNSFKDDPDIGQTIKILSEKVPRK